MPLPKEERYTLADMLAWETEKRYELIDGIPYLMSPGPSRRHQRIGREIYRQISTYLLGKTYEVYIAPFDVRLFEQSGEGPESVDTVVRPDISVICDTEKLDETGCKGAPDLVIEVLSPSTHNRDRLTKFNLYQRAGVREYWIVDPQIRPFRPFSWMAGAMS